MRKKRILWIMILLIALSCSTDEENNDSDKTTEEVSIRFKFSHRWDEQELGNSDLNSIKFTTENGDQLSIERLRYLISGISLRKASGETIEIEGYNLVDFVGETGLTFSPSETISEGEYTNLSFTFGFDNEDNQDGVYPDLNSVIWNVPEMLGGGYHYMQLEGKFIDDTATETGYQYHAIRAVDISGTSPIFQDTFFEVDLGPIVVSEGAEFEIQMNVAEWFKNPNLWDLNVLNSMLMPNFDAQLMISENGRNAFELKTPTD